MCRVLGVSRSGYYKRLNAHTSLRHKKREAIRKEAIYYHARSRSIYGYRKVAADIKIENGVTCSTETVRRVMRDNQLFSRVKHKFVVTTQSGHSLPVAKNLLNRDFKTDYPNQKWATDITYIRTLEGWLYLAGVMDLYSRRIVGWAVSSRIDGELVRQALDMAIRERQPGSGLLHHSDRGVQYAAYAYQEILKTSGMICSMSRKGNCWDNAGKESFFDKLKSEWIRGKIYRTFAEARSEIFLYIETFYNRVRRHASLGYVSPVEFEQRGDRTTAA